MKVLGITDGITGGAAVVEDGQILSAVNEERLVRKKMAIGFPRSSIAEVLKLANVKPSELDFIAVGGTDDYFKEEVKDWEGWFQEREKIGLRANIFSAASVLGRFAGTIPGLEEGYYFLRRPIFRKRRKRIEEVLREEFDVHAPIVFVDHHLAHAASAYYTAGFPEATVVTMDGGGDGCSSHIYFVRDGTFQLITKTSSYNSLGNYYAYITHICGFKAQKHEGKITGLAAHGKPTYREILNEFITIEDGRILNCGKLVFKSAIYGIRNRLPEDFSREDLAASIQMNAEHIAVEYVRHWMSKGGPPYLAIAGGVFANVRINQELHEISGVKGIFVHPGMADCGLGVGAALALSSNGLLNEPMPSDITPLRDVYFGPEFSEREIEEALRKTSFEFKYHQNVEAEIARLLKEGYVVAWFNGRMEYGPRALGNRSILYQPGDPGVNDWLNNNLRRTEFMPFAPSTLMEYADECYHGVQGAEKTARFMTITFNCTDWMKKHCPGVVHLDETARPQLVVREENPRYYRIIDEFRKLTGIPTVINTSFNMHEEPIVCTPQDALRAFDLGHLDYLALGSFLVKNPLPLTHEIVPFKGTKA